MITFEFQALGSQTTVPSDKLAPHYHQYLIGFKNQSTSRLLAKNLRLRSEPKPLKNTVKILFFSFLRFKTVQSNNEIVITLINLGRCNQHLANNLQVPLKKDLMRRLQ